MHKNILHTLNATEQAARRDGHILWYTHFRKLFVLLFLMLASVGARANDYVFTYTSGGTTYYLASNGANAVQRLDHFDPTICIWHCSSSNTNINNTGTLTNSTTYGYLYQSINGENRFLYYYNNSWGLNNRQNTYPDYYRFRLNADGYVWQYRNGTSRFYITLNNNSVGARDIENSNGNCAKAYEVTATPHAAQDNMTLTLSTNNNVRIIETVGNSLGISTTLNGNYTPAYINYSWNNNQQRHNWYNGTDYGDQTPQLHGGSTYNYTWSREPTTHATLSANQIWNSTLTYSSPASTDEVVTVKLTIENATIPDFHKEASIEITLVAPIPTYTVTTSPLPGGTLSATPTSGHGGETITIQATTNLGYQFDSWDVTAEGTTINVVDATATQTTFTMPAANVNVSANFTTIPYTITIADNIAHGNISSSANTATIGTTVTLTATPEEGYELQSWNVTTTGGSSVEVTDNSFIMPASNVVVSATFSVANYTITVNPSIQNGSVTSSLQTATMGTTVTLTATPNANYMFSAWDVRDASDRQISVTDNQFTMPASNVTVSATFTAIPYHITIANNIAHGSISSSASTATAGTTITLSATPDEDYALQSWSVTTSGGSSVEVNNNSFIMPGSDVTVSATFYQPVYTVTVNHVEHGSITAEPTSGTRGTQVTLTATPETEYELVAWNVRDASGNSIAVSNDNKFTMPASNVTVSARFSVKLYTISIASNIQNGSVTATHASAPAGTSVSLAATPATGYRLTGWSVKDADNASVTVSGNSFIMPSKNVTVSASFSERVTYPEYGTCADGSIQISDLQGLQNMTANGRYCLSDDINASEWTGSGISNFSGTFDGNYHTITGLTHALFNSISGGTVKNVRLDEVIISNGTDVGAIANTATNAKIYNCGVLSGSVSGTGAVGGIVGRISGNTKVVNNYNYASISGGTYAAGVVGYNKTYLHQDDGTSMVDWPRPTGNTEGNYGANNQNRPDNYSNGNLNGGTCEAWRGSKLQNQNIRHTELNNLPAGTYTISVDLVINRADPTGIQFYLNGNTAINNQEVVHNNGYYEAHIERQVEIAANGSITFGFTLNNANFNWMQWDNARVELVNSEVLTSAMYHQWSSYQAGATDNGATTSENNFGQSAGTVWGLGTVPGNCYADLTNYKEMVIYFTLGTPRVLFNRPCNTGGSEGCPGALEIMSNTNEYVKSSNNRVWTIDIEKIVQRDGYAHLNVIKGLNGNVTISKVELVKSPAMVANCVNYGTEVSGDNKYPVYGGTDLDNKTNPLYDFFLYDGASYRENIASTNGALPAEARFLNRFEYVRATLNAEKKLAAYYLFGTQNKTDQDQIGKWVLDTKIAPYPVIKPWFDSDGNAIKYPSLVNPDVSDRTIGILSVNITGHGSVSLPISDQLEKEFDYGYHKVQLPYYNDYFNDNYQANKVVTGWKITSVSGGTAGSFTTSGNNAYNFADRDCTQKDLYSVSGRIFAQGGYYYVPEGVTGITIEPYWANDVVYLCDPNIDKVFGMGYTETNYGPTYQPTFTVPTGAKVHNTLRDAHDELTASINVYDHAIVLIGNVNFRRNGAPLNNYDTKAYTIMSIDEDHDNEPDYAEIYGHVDRKPVPPTRLDFVHQVGISWVKKPMGETLQSYSGIPLTRGHFEITETAFARFTEFETGTHVNKGPLIFNAGLIDQFVTNRDSDNPNIDYAILGGHTYFSAYTPGCHPNSTRKTTFWPVSVMGGEYAEFYLTGMKSEVVVEAQNGRVYTNGGKMGTFAGAYWEQLNGDAIIRFDHTWVKEFFGGGINPAKPITGKIDIIINNCDVDFFCAGPKAGNMTQGKTVTTIANNDRFGTYVGAGYGGSSVARFQMHEQVNNIEYINQKTNYFNSFSTDYLKYVNQRGILVRYAVEYMPGSGGMGGSLNPTHVTRFYNDYAQLNLAQTYSVTSTLNGCTVRENFYGGPYSGTVGTSAKPMSVTSSLSNCTVYGNVYGGGKSATIPDITVYPNDINSLKTPLYNGNFGVYYQEGEDKFPVYPEGEEYTWKQVATLSANPWGTENGKKYLETTVDLNSLGSVFGNTHLTVTNSTVEGYVFGGGDASKVTQYTKVIVDNSEVKKDVFGGGFGAPVGTNTAVWIKGENCFIHGSVLGGGFGGDVSGDTHVQIGESANGDLYPESHLSGRN